ncbi:MAG: hypothetical protein Alpg2KO_21010 [Alphaproteobacteria bacterium]
MKLSNKGATGLSYGLVVGLIALGALAALQTVGGSTKSLFETTSGTLANASNSTANGGSGGDAGATPTPAVGPFASCAAQLAADPSSTHGVYQIDPDGSGGNAAFDAYCDMTTSGGGWTLVVKSMLNNSDLIYSSGYWTNGQTLNPTAMTLWDSINAVHESYATVSGEEFLIRLNNDASQMVIDASGSSAAPATAQTFASQPEDAVVDEYYDSSNSNCDWANFMTRDSAWNLQRGAVAKGVNLRAGRAFARFGIIAENERVTSLNSTGWDSSVGLGVSGYNDGTLTGMGSGNFYWPNSACSSPYGLNATGQVFWPALLFIR